MLTRAQTMLSADHRPVAMLRARPPPAVRQHQLLRALAQLHTLRHGGPAAFRCLRPAAFNDWHD
jgi:hypothetical protein